MYGMFGQNQNVLIDLPRRSSYMVLGLQALTPFIHICMFLILYAYIYICGKIFHGRTVYI